MNYFFRNIFKFFILLLILFSIVACNKKNIITYDEILSVPSNNKRLTAVIVKNSINNEYRFGIKSRNETLLIIENNFIPIGYHEPSIKIIWNKLDDKIYLTIDHDFGENKLKYIFDVINYSLIDDNK